MSVLISESDLKQIDNRENLFAFLGDKLNWPVSPQDTFTYSEQLLSDKLSHVSVSRIVPFTSDDPLTIFLAEFEGGFRRTELRSLLSNARSHVRKTSAFGGHNLDNMVFVCPVISDDSRAVESYNGLRFAHLESPNHQQHSIGEVLPSGSSSSRLKVFGFDRDRISETRTLREENLPALSLTLDADKNPDWAACKNKWLSAWDVEKVTDAFFKKYKSVFEQVETMIAGVKGDRRLFTQRLFNRLMFVHFLSQKGWLKFGPKERTDYLAALWDGRDKRENFYEAHLCTLFFAGLNNPQSLNLCHDNPAVFHRIGRVPFLNGGLFSEDKGERCGESVPDEAIRLILHDLFSPWNFTISESTPDDIDVAVDPEMLGKVFEELVTGRHETGSYYTPRPIVSFMCREALKGHLGGGEAIAALVDEKNASAIADPESTLEALKTVRVVDPACGSGAYLLGMQQELLDIRKCLFQSKRVDANNDYRRKLEIIQKNLYGVDNDEFAVNTARLRLWLSLIVEYDKQEDVANLPPLPNLDFKIEQGDSLAAPHPHAVSGLFRDALVRAADRLSRLKAEYLHETAGRKAQLRKEIEAEEADLSELLVDSPSPEGAFDWRVRFAEVFANQESPIDIGGKFNFGGTLAEPPKQGGFDIVLANPPYVRQELIKEQKPILKAVFPEIYNGTADLYCYFYARALQLLRPGGMLVFISPNNWFRSGYGAYLRKFIANTCQVDSITDFGELPVFQSAATFPMIFAAKLVEDTKVEASTIFTQVKSLTAPYPNVLALQKRDGHVLPPDAIVGTSWMLTDAATAKRIRKMEAEGVPLGEYVKGKIYRGILTGFNAAFIISGEKRAELIAADKKSAEIIKPLAVGDNVRKWHIDQKDKWLIVIKIGIDIKRYSAIFQHLQQWQPELEKRSDKGPNWWELRPCSYYPDLEGAKIVYPEIAMSSRFTLDRTGTYPLKTVFSIVSDDLYLLGVLNSNSAWDYLKRVCSVLGDEEARGRLTLQTIFVERLPIPLASATNRAAISVLVQKCLDKKGVGVEAEEAEISARVAALYGL